MLGLLDHEVHSSAEGWSPVYVDDNFGVMSIGFLLGNQDDAVIWRGPRKNGLIKQFLTDVNWGELDYLIVDSNRARNNIFAFTLIPYNQLLLGHPMSTSVSYNTFNQVRMMAQSS